MSGFSYRKNLDGSAYAPINMRFVGKDSIAFQVGDLVRINTSTVIDVVDATEAIAGVCVGVEDKNGLPVATDSGTTDTWTMASDNTTVNLYKVIFIPALPNYLFYADGDASNSSGDEFAFTDVTDHNSPANSYGDATAQLRLIERDPDHDADASKGLYQVAESQFGTTLAVAAA
jgi:hypothetical protein